MSPSAALTAALAALAAGQVPRPGRSIPAAPGLSARWWEDPRGAVLIVLGLIVVLGGGSKVLQAMRARTAVRRVQQDSETSPGGTLDDRAVADLARHGRAGLTELFRLLTEGPTEKARRTAGLALAVLWKRDELITEEEKAVVNRGFDVHWKARRRYPRAIRSEIPIVVTYGIPFLGKSVEGIEAHEAIGPGDLEWSHRVVGARRASLEVFSPWTRGAPSIDAGIVKFHGAQAAFTIVPGDFETNGPHRLVLQVRVRPVGLTAAWELELPHVRFQFEFDPILEVNALLALPDTSRADAFRRSVRFVQGAEDAKGDGRLEGLDAPLCLRRPTDIEVELPLPCDLAHAVEVEFEGIEGWFHAGFVDVSMATTGELAGRPGAGGVSCPLGPVRGLPAGAIDRPGRWTMRARLVPDPDRGWGDPDVRSIWPGVIETDPVEVEIVRL
jgi:hypothetical protein